VHTLEKCKYHARIKENLAQDIFKYLDYIEKNYSNSRFTGLEYLFRCKTLDLAL
jgi:hypothetical protein